MAFDQNRVRNKCIKDAVIGGFAGLIVAVSLVFLAAFLIDADAQTPYGRESRDGSPIAATYLSAQQECQEAAHADAPTASDLGACDYALNAPGLNAEDQAHLLVNRAVIALNRNMVRPALADLEEAVRLHPDFAEAHLNLSAAAIRARQYRPALSAAEHALALNIDQPALAHFNRAIALEGLELWDQAYAAYGDAAALAPENAVFGAQQGRFRRQNAPALP